MNIHSIVNIHNNMTQDPNTTKLLYKVAKAYYEENLTYQEIGERYGFSRMKVARLLAQAQEEKIVQILIAPLEDPYLELERRLEAKYGLYQAVVVKPAGYDQPQVTQALGQAAASFLVNTLNGKEIVAMTWGNTVLSIINELPPRNFPDMIVVPTTGGLGRVEAETYGIDLVRRMAQAFRAKPYLLPAPGIVRSKMACEALLAEPQISEALSLAARADICIVGIGKPAFGSFLVHSGILTDDEVAQLLACGAVGDIALRFFDAKGKAVSHEINDRIIGLDLEQIKKIPRVVGVAGGDGKAEIIRAALYGQLIKVLITDDRTAACLLVEATRSNNPGDQNGAFI